MRRPPNRQTNLFFLSCIVLLSAAGVLAATLPQAHASIQAAGRAQAAKLIGEAASASPPEAAVNYKIATWLDPSNQAGYLGLARIQIAAGNAETALKALERAGEGSEAASLRVRTLIELGRTTEAADRAATLAAAGRPDADIILAAITYALAGRTGDILALIPLVASPEAAGRINRIAAGEMPLAGELYANGLPESSRSLLAKLPMSFERNLLLARLHYDQHTPESLVTATDLLKLAVALNPGNAEAHKFLAAVYTERKLPAEAATQSELAQKLTGGRP
jgi:cytochrome c-type biogenesis protein CcmH/NrfG